MYTNISCEVKIPAGKWILLVASFICLWHEVMFQLSRLQQMTDIFLGRRDAHDALSDKGKTEKGEINPAEYH